MFATRLLRNLKTTISQPPCLQKLGRVFTVPQRSLIYKTLEDVKNEDMVKKMPSGACESRRYILKKDGLGFSFHWTVVYPNIEMYIHYRHHYEAVICVQGEGELEVMEPMAKPGNGKKYKLYPGTMYALNGHEAHYLRGGKEDLHFICVFNPPCVGTEKHGADGGYELLE